VAAVPTLPAGSAPRVCVVMMSAVGDAVHVLPVLTALKRHAPRAHVTWILQGAPAALVRGHWAVDEILPFERAGGVAGYRRLGRALRTRGPFDLCLALQVYLKAGLVTALVPARVKLGFDRARARDANWLFTNARIPARPKQHVQDQYFEFLDALGVPHEPPRWDLGPWAHERAWQREFLARHERPLAGVVVASSDPSRNWMPERIAALCDALYEREGLQPVLLGGRSAAELAAEAEIRRVARHAPVSTLGASFREMVALIDGSALVVSPNTAGLHIAVALDRPVITLSGTWDPRRTGPYRRFHDLVVDTFVEPTDAPDEVLLEKRADGRMARISVDDVLARVAVWRERHADAALAHVAAVRAGAVPSAPSRAERPEPASRDA
jgi:heptosyltransferase I